MGKLLYFPTRVQAVKPVQVVPEPNYWQGILILVSGIGFCLLCWFGIAVAIERVLR